MSPRARFRSCSEKNLDLLFDTDLSGNVCKSWAHIKFNHPANISLLKRQISMAGFQIAYMLTFRFSGKKDVSSVFALRSPGKSCGTAE